MKVKDLVKSVSTVTKSVGAFKRRVTIKEIREDDQINPNFFYKDLSDEAFIKEVLSTS